MNPFLFLVISMAGGAGAGVRFLVDALISKHKKMSFPLGTNIINVSGSLLLGLVVGLAAAGALAEPWALVLGTGFLGGYTTFSTASYETLRLLADGRRWTSASNALGMLTASVVAAALGLTVGMFFAH